MLHAQISTRVAGLRLARRALLLQALALSLIAVGTRKCALYEARRAVDFVAVLAVGVGRDIVAVAAGFRVAAGAGLGALRPIIVAPLTNLPRAGGALAKGRTVAELLLTIAAGLEEAL